MNVRLIQRGKRVHCGIVVGCNGKPYTVSPCNGIWDTNDKTSVGEPSEVTCKRCQKIIARADENGQVDL